MCWLDHKTIKLSMFIEDKYDDELDESGEPRKKRSANAGLWLWVIIT